MNPTASLGSCNDIKAILESNNIHMKESIYKNLSMLLNADDRHTHVAFLLDKNHNVLSYQSNIYFKTNTYPYSQHAEVGTIIKYYSSKIMNQNHNNKKILLVIKLKSKKLGSSKPCQNCANFILNNWDNLKLKQIIYSDGNGNLNILDKNNLINDEFCISSASTVRNRHRR